MSLRTIGRVAVLLAAAWCTVREAHACAVPSGLDRTAVLFNTCLHAQRPARKACERAYVVYAGTVARPHNWSK